jgi:hypothetical protein
VKQGATCSKTNQFVIEMPGINRSQNREDLKNYIVGCKNLGHSSETSNSKRRIFHNFSWIVLNF